MQKMSDVSTDCTSHIPCAWVRDGKVFMGDVMQTEVLPDSVYLLDCLEGMKNMEDESIDLIATDPPYCINYSTHNRKDKTHDFCSPIQAGDLQAQFGQQYEVILLLNKGRAPFFGKRIGDVWHFPRVAGKKQLHQNQKPLELMIQCIEKHSQEGDVVFDGFMGSGTTAVAALRTGRRFIGFEIEPRYWRMAADRIAREVEARQDGGELIG